MKKALVTAAIEGDDGTEVWYLELVGNGMNGLAGCGKSFLGDDVAPASSRQLPSIQRRPARGRRYIPAGAEFFGSLLNRHAEAMIFFDRARLHQRRA